MRFNTEAPAKSGGAIGGQKWNSGKLDALLSRVGAGVPYNFFNMSGKG